MITDKESNFIYISDLLENQCPDVYRQLKYWFDKLGIAYATLLNTKDLWVVDFMPLQIDKATFLAFNYDPDYLKPKKYQPKKSVLNEVYNVSDYNKFDIVLDGGNVVKHRNKVILTSKIFKENPNYLEDDLLTEIKVKLKVKKVIIIPQEPGDFVGHADGMVRFIDSDTVLLNQYPLNKTYKTFGADLRSALRNAGLRCVELPYTSWQNKDDNDATGCYINFLETGNYIFYPVFNDHKNDFQALEKLKSVFKDQEFIGIPCRELSKYGGVLNCATWNILY
jgi:agmatine deiminase